MKHRKLHAIAHNFADSLASGMCFVLDVYLPCAVFVEAAANPRNELTIDFLSGTIEAEQVSEDLLLVAATFRASFPRFCAKHGAGAEDFREFCVCFSTGHSGNRYIVTITDKAGKRSSIVYKGTPGRREKMLDNEGRVRPNFVIHDASEISAS